MKLVHFQGKQFCLFHFCLPPQWLNSYRKEFANKETNRKSAKLFPFVKMDEKHDSEAIPEPINLLMDSSTVICWISPLVILGVSGLFCCFYSSFDGKSCLIANNVDTDQMPHYVVSDLGLNCLPRTLLRVSRYEWVKTYA